MFSLHKIVKPLQAKITKLPKNLLAKTLTIKNTKSVLEQMLQVISALNAHVESGLQRSNIFPHNEIENGTGSMPHLDIVVQLLSNMQSSQIKSLSTEQLTQQEPEHLEQHSQADEISS